MHRLEVDVWQAQARLGQQLLRWGGFSAAIGIFLTILPGQRFLNGLGSQTALWGLIDAVIAWLGIRSAHRKITAPDAHLPVKQHKAREALHRTLWINTILDVGYVMGGLVLANSIGRRDSFWRGSGLGIIIQGGFLLIFDALHALSLRPAQCTDVHKGGNDEC